MSDAAPALAPAFDAIGEAKRLLRTVRAGALATLDPEGNPFASLVSVATLMAGEPVLLLSQLSGHTRHLTADGRCSLLLAATGKGDPLAHPRLTLVGRAARLAGDAAAVARERFLSRQPKARLYVDFPDFSFWRVDPDAGHLNGGFARAATLEGRDLLCDAPALAAIERSAVEHMNADHRDALALYATVLAGAGAGEWVASGVDPEGLDLVCGDRVARVGFEQPVSDGQQVRAALAALARQAREIAGIAPEAGAGKAGP